VSTDTEVRVQQLCSEVLAAKTKADVERIIPELRAALEDHIRLAKDSLGEQQPELRFSREQPSRVLHRHNSALSIAIEILKKQIKEIAG